MQLFLLRHGDAEIGGADESRQLSAYGREQVLSIADSHRKQCQDLQWVVSSPYVRAAQTAELFISASGLKTEIDWLDDLTPQGNLHAIQAYLQQTQAAKLLMVSHLPLVALLIDYLSGETGSRMATANLASLSMQIPAAGQATLNWIHYAN